MALAWYWWVLIGFAVVVIGYLKLKVFKSILQKRESAKKAAAAEEE